MADIRADNSTSKRVKRPDRTRLFEIASEQSGYFTADQARTCGFSWALLSHHVKSGTFARVRPGLYRFREYPSSPREHVIAAWLAVGKDIAVVSHESALELLDLSDVIPSAVHLTVSRARRDVPSTPGVKIHTTIRPLRQDERVVRDGMGVTSAARSILDAAEAGIAPEQVAMAVAQALERGLATRDQLLTGGSERGGRVAKLIANALQETA